MRIKVWTIALVAAVTAGCGAAEYEAKLSRTVERLNYLDEDQRLLGPPVQLPVQTPRVSIRLPNSVKSEPIAVGRTSGSNQANWLFRFDWTNAGQKLPPIQVLIGVHIEGSGQTLEQRIQAFLTEHIGFAPTSSTDENFSRLADPPGRRERRYHKFTGAGEDKNPSLAESPLPFPSIYRYDVYVHESRKAAVIMKELDVAATKKRWQAEGAGDMSAFAPLENAQGQEAFDRLPEQRKRSLATLTVN